MAHAPFSHGAWSAVTAMQRPLVRCALMAPLIGVLLLGWMALPASAGVIGIMRP